MRPRRGAGRGRLTRVDRPADPSIVFVHAHPDDEAIFTGGTMRLLASAGHRIVLVVATGGELGLVPAGLDEVRRRRPGGVRERPAAVEPPGPAVARGGPGPPAPDPLAAHRTAETDAAARLLGVGRVRWLGYRDSGMAGDPANRAPGSFWAADDGEAADRLARILRAEAAAAVVVYDATGIYGHPDHVKVHRIGRRAATAAGVSTVYDVTVDREYLHFVETHLVEEAILAGDLGLVRSHIGLPSVEIDATVDVRTVLDVKRAAMAAHASQIPESTSALRLPTHHFADVYGWEWYVRTGPVGPIDAL